MEAIKAYILAHDLKPGDPLPTEAILCEAVGVSRSSVREALRKLEALDIITSHQGRGSFVGEMSMQPLVDTLVLRSALERSTGKRSLSEVITIRRALDLGVAEELITAFRGTRNPRMWDLVDRMTDLSHQGRAYYEEDIAFHSQLLERLDSALLQQLMSAMWLIHQTVTPFLEAADASSLEQTAQAHARILKACEDGDLDAYRIAIDEHYAPVKQLLADAAAETADATASDS